MILTLLQLAFKYGIQSTTITKEESFDIPKKDVIYFIDKTGLTIINNETESTEEYIAAKTNMTITIKPTDGTQAELKYAYFPINFTEYDYNLTIITNQEDFYFTNDSSLIKTRNFFVFIKVDQEKPDFTFVNNTLVHIYGIEKNLTDTNTGLLTEYITIINILSYRKIFLILNEAVYLRPGFGSIELKASQPITRETFGSGYFIPHMIEDIEIVSVRNPVPISEKTYYSDTSYDVTITSTKDVVFYYTLFEKPEEIGTCDEEFIYFRNDQKPFYAGLDSNSKQKNLIISDKNKTVCGYVIVAAPSYTIENTNFHRYYSTYEQDYRSSFAIKMGPQNIKDFDILYSLPFYPAGDIKFRKSEIIYHTDLITVQSNVTNDYSSTSALNGYYEYYYRINIPKDGLDLNFDKCTLVFHNGPKFTMVEKGGKEFLGNTGIDVINATSPAFFTIKPLNESETYHELNLTISNPSEYSFHDIYVIPPNDFNFYVLVHNEDQYKNILTNISAFKRMKFNIEIHNLHSFNHLTWSNKGRYESENEITKGSIISRIQYNSGHDLYTKSFSAYRSNKLL